MIDISPPAVHISGKSDFADDDAETYRWLMSDVLAYTLGKHGVYPKHVRFFGKQAEVFVADEKLFGTATLRKHRTKFSRVKVSSFQLAEVP